MVFEQVSCGRLGPPRLGADLPVTSFRQQNDAGQGPAYLHLHLWYHAMLIMLYRPPLIYPRTNAADLSLADRLAVVNNSSLSIGQILSCADVSLFRGNGCSRS